MRSRAATTLVVLGVAITIAVGWDRVRDPQRSHDGAPAGWPLGFERVYACELATRAELPARGTPERDKLVDHRMNGRLALTVIATRPELVVRARYTGEALSLAGSTTGTAEVSQAAVQRSLAQPFHLVFRSNGELAHVRVAPDTIPYVTGMLRELATAVRITLPGNRGENWEVTEEDAGGAYIARYRVLAGLPGAPRVVRKHKERYLDGATVVVASQTELKLDDTRVLRSIRSHETLRSVRGPLPGLEVATELTLVLVATTDRRGELVRWLKEHHSVRDGVTKDVTFQNAIDRASIAGWQYADILAILRAHALAKQAGTPSKEDKERAARAYTALTALLRSHPEQLALARTQIVEDSPLANTLVAALRDAGTPEAQAVLRELLVEPRVAARRPRVARGLSLVAHPTAATVETLQALQTDAQLGVQATYGLGSALHRLRNQDPVLASKVLGHLIAQLTTADTVSRTVELLNALGNAGHPETIVAIQPYLRNADEQIRAAAARALRRVPGPHADGLLSGASADPSATVRAGAVEAFTQREPSVVLAGALAPRLVDEPEFSIRARAVHLAVGWLPQARAVLLGPLTRVAEHDASSDLRRIASAALN